MSVRHRSLSTIVFAISFAALAVPRLAAQERPPAWTRLPEDPSELPRLVAAGEQRASVVFFTMGCPSDGGWAGLALEALLQAAETDFEVRRSLASAFGHAVRWRDRWGEEHPCPTEVPRYEAWLAGQLRREWQEGLLLEGNEEPVLAWSLIRGLGASRNPATHALVREIARDADVGEFFRRHAASFMVDHHFGALMLDPDYDDPRVLDAYQAVLFDLATAPPLIEFEINARAIVRSQRGESFEREYERVLREAGRIRR